MHWLTLPEPRKNIAQSFHDLASAKAWLASQPQAKPMHMLAAVSLQIEAIEASTTPASAGCRFVEFAANRSRTGPGSHRAALCPQGTAHAR